MLPVAGRVWVVARGYRVLASDFAVEPFDDEFSAALISEHFLGCVGCLFLRAMDARSLVSVVALLGPLPVSALVNCSVAVFAHGKNPPWMEISTLR